MAARYTLRNADGQAFSPTIHFGRIARERPHELTGLLKGIIADGEINTSEAAFVVRWLESNQDYIAEWPFDVLYERFVAALADGTITGEEERELLGLVAAHVGSGFAANGANASSQLLCDDPVPMIEFERSVFVVTGAFISGKRGAIEAIIHHLGGICRDSVTGKTGYLLIGDAGSRDWLMSNYGTKIMAAAERKREGQPIGVVNERNFLRQLEPLAGRLGALLSHSLRQV